MNTKNWLERLLQLGKLVEEDEQFSIHHLLGYIASAEAIIKEEDCDLLQEKYRFNCDCACHDKPEPFDWEKEFVRRFGGTNLGDGGRNNDFVKTFIRKALTKATQSAQREMKESFKKMVEDIYIKLARQQLVLSNGKLPFTFFFGDRSEEEKFVMVYQQALEDFYRHISRLNDELPSK